MSVTLLTAEDVAKRWQVSVKTIDNYRKEGKLVPVSGINAIRYNLHYIEEIEGSIDENMTWIERKLRVQVEDLTKENERLKSIIATIGSQCTTAIYSKNT